MKQMKKMMLLGLIVCSVFLSDSAVKAAFLETDTLSDSKLCDRVYEEVLSGEITSDADVLKVALAQYEERIRYSSKMKELEQVDDNLSITQLVGSQIDENGHIIKDIVTTGLLVLDKNDNIVKASSITTGSAGLNEYSIYATMNVSVTNDTSQGTVRFNWFETKLTYGTAMAAGSLIQYSQYTPEPFFPYDDITKQINYPQANVAYRYTPANKTMVTYMNLTCGRICSSTINAGSKSVQFGYAVTNNTGANGSWDTKYL